MLPTLPNDAPTRKPVYPQIQIAIITSSSIIVMAIQLGTRNPTAGKLMTLMPLIQREARPSPPVPKDNGLYNRILYQRHRRLHYRRR